MYFGHTKEKKVIRNSQCGYSKNKSCLTNLILFYDKIIALVDKGRGMEGIYLDFSKNIQHSFPECLKTDSKPLWVDYQMS